MKSNILTVFCWGTYLLFPERRNQITLYRIYFLSGKNKTCLYKLIRIFVVYHFFPYLYFFCTLTNVLMIWTCTYKTMLMWRNSVFSNHIVVILLSLSLTHTHTHTVTRLFLWIVGTFHRLILLLYWPNNIFPTLTLNLPLTENLCALLHFQINIIHYS